MALGDIRFVLPRPLSKGKQKDNGAEQFLFTGQRHALEGKEHKQRRKHDGSKARDDAVRPGVAKTPEKLENKEGRSKGSNDAGIQFLFQKRHALEEKGQSSLKRKRDESIAREAAGRTDDNAFPAEVKSKQSRLEKERGGQGSADRAEVKASPEKLKSKKSGITTNGHHRNTLIRSVDDALQDKVGRRPRANSTDRELDLPQHGLCDERTVLLSHKWDTTRLSKRPIPRGYLNLGNTCFLNATLQCLAYMPSFCQSIAALPESCYGKNGSRAHGQQITMLMRALLRNTHGMTSKERNEPPKMHAIAPNKLHRAITSCKINGHRFRPGRQEDAHEFLVHLLDAMHEGELFAAGINPRASGWRDKLPIPRLDETTFVHRIFGGYFRSQLKCNKCGYKSNKYDPFLDLALEVSKKHINSIHAAFAEFTRKEKLDADNRWKCSGCRQFVCPSKSLTVFRPPLSLCIHLKRFEFDMMGGFGGFDGWMFGHRQGKGMGGKGGGSKISKKIDFPVHLSLPLSDKRVCEYMLTGVVIHVGSSATNGHYTAFVRLPGGSKQWCYCDDSHVEMVPEKRVLKQSNAYVLFYTRKEVKIEYPPPPR